MSTAIELKTIGITGQTGAELATWLGKQLSGGVKDLGVSPAYLIRLAADFDLGTEDLSMLITARKDFAASFGRIRRFLDKGMDVEAITNVFQARAEVLSLLPEKDRGIPLGLIIRFTELFPGFDLGDDGLGEKLVDLFHAVEQVNQFGWVKYPYQAIRIICEVAEGFGLTDPDAAVDAITNGFGVEEGGD